jgi:hypothetical protein
VDPQSGEYTDLGLTGMSSLTLLMQANCSESMKQSGWQNTKFMVAIDGFLYMFCTDLYKIDLKNPSEYSKISDSWGNTVSACAAGIVISKLKSFKR